ncbi:hypothetical protein F0U64_08525 [Achromobacter xylosoxidans]|uniref:phage baseplate protein n=1 Tax=Alcaligenes xylosoxydans xylosoxydans TaxID=85698 RepID=UPI0006C53058|nr:hypothetical protein [Achromobacter xylosoxidans]MCZ8440981.1 hypothetical protein [Achromobacter xylosoxidans]QEQ22426.1 hypothetical protein F0U64_08525 [Achromobacter xylosoxidans]CUK09355.1 Uncharacterised protein [Achromobacter xylosoxidans]
MADLNIASADMVGLLSKKIGDIVVEATLSESHEDTLKITSHPVESGPYGKSAISDHAFKQPLTLTLKCAWSNASYEALAGAQAKDVANGKAAADDYATAIYSQLLSLQESREPVTVVTSRRRYSDMLIEKLSVETNKDSFGAVFATVTLREVVVVQTRSTSLPPYAGQKEKEKTADKQNLGVKTPRPVAAPNGGSLHWN